MPVKFKDSININSEYTFPLVDGDNGQSLITDGAGNVSFGDVSAVDAEAVHLDVKNTSGATINKGTPVYITGNVGNTNKLEIAPADASDAAKMPAVGLLESTLADNAEGFVAQGGYLKGLSTDTIDGTSTSSNDTVYVKAGGGLTMTKPTGTNYIQNVAKVARVHASNGSLVVSSILRTNDVPTPLYIDHTNQRLGIGTATPSEKLDVDGNVESNSVILNGGGSSPAIYMERGDGTDIKVFQLNPSTDNLTIGSTAIDKLIFQDDSGTAMTLDGSGNVGIGTSSPNGKLHVYEGSSGQSIPNLAADTLVLDGSSSTGISIFNNNTGVGSIFFGDSDDNFVGGFRYDHADNSLDVNVNNALAVTIDSSRNVGIGITSPAYKLDVAGNIRVDSTSVAQIFLDSAASNDAVLNFHENASQKGKIGYDTSLGGIALVAGSGAFSTADMVLLDGGNVGIGTTSPAAKLHAAEGSSVGISSVYATAIIESGDAQLDITSGPGGTWGSSLNFVEGNGASNTDVWSIARQTTGGNGDSSLRINFGTTNQHDNVNKFKLDTAGSITIPGNATVGGDLIVNGTTTTLNTTTVEVEDNILQLNTTQGTPDTATAATSGISIYRGDGITQASLIFDDADDTWDLTNNLKIAGHAYAETYRTSRTDGDIYIQAASPSDFVSIGTEGGNNNLLRVQGDGNVGIGTTSPDTKFHVVKGGSGEQVVAIFQNDTNEDETKASIQLRNTTNDVCSTKIISHRTGANFGADLAFELSDNVDGSFQERMRITETGNVGIGTTSPSATLEVSGSIKLSQGIEYWHRSYSVSTSNEASILQDDGAALLNGGALRVTGHISATGTDQSSRAVFWNRNGTWNCNLTAASGTSSNHILFYVDSVTGLPSVKTYHSSNYEVHVFHERIDLNEGNGTDNSRHYFGADSYMTQIGNDISMFTTYSGNNTGGNLGIGISNPSIKLAVASPGDTSVVLGAHYSSTNPSRFFDVGVSANDGYLNLRNSGAATTIHLDSDGNSYLNGGNFGIGTTSPSQLLHVTDGSGGEIAIGTNTSAVKTLMFGINNDYSIQSNGGSYLRFYTEGTESMRMDSSGNVGIGTASPVDKLTIYDSDNNVGAYFQTANSGTSASDGLRVGLNNTHAFIWNYENTPIAFGTNGSQKATILANGRVGIGTTSPARVLHIVDPSVAAIQLENTSEADSFIDFMNPSRTFRVGYDDSADVFKVAVTNFNSNALVVNPSGNVGIGTTTPNSKLQVVGKATSFSTVSTDAATTLVTKDYVDSSTGNSSYFRQGHKSHNLTNAFTTCLTVNLSNHNSCYVTVCCFGDWGSHSAAAYRGEFFLQNGANGYNEPGIILRQDDNTSNSGDQIVCQILDPTSTANPKNFEIQIRTTATTGTTGFTGTVTFTVQGQFNSVT